MGGNPFDACLPDGVLEEVEQSKNLRKAKESTVRTLQVLNEARKAAGFPTTGVVGNRDDYADAHNRERSEAERLDQEARNELHRACREHIGATRCPVVEPWSAEQEFTTDAPTEDETPDPEADPLSKLKARRCEPTWDEILPQQKGFAGRQWWGIFLAAFFGLAWLYSLKGANFGGAVFSFLICAALSVGIFRITVLLGGSSGAGGGRGGGSFNGSAV